MPAPVGPAGPPHNTSPRSDEAAPSVLLYVGLPRDSPDAADVASVVDLAETLQEFARDLAPGAQTVTAVSLTGDEPDVSDLIPEPRSLRFLAAPERQARRTGVDGIHLDRSSRTLHVDGGARTLTPRECELLGYLMDHPGRAISRRELIEKAWADARPASPRTVDEYVRRLRRALDPHQQDISTVPGYGYRFGQIAEVAR